MVSSDSGLSVHSIKKAVDKNVRASIRKAKKTPDEDFTYCCVTSRDKTGVYLNVL